MMLLVQILATRFWIIAKSVNLREKERKCVSTVGEKKFNSLGNGNPIERLCISRLPMEIVFFYIHMKI